MGGVFRVGHASSVMTAGDDRAQKVFHLGEPIWEKPIVSIYPARVLSTTDNALFVGSSDIACLTYSNWHPRDHDWPNVFRANYEGSMQGDISGRTRPGMAAAVTLGRMPLDVILRDAANGVYPEQNNPLNPASMALYDVLVLDVSDVVLSPEGDNEEYYGITNMPAPFHWTQYGTRQHWLNTELEGRMQVARIAHQAGVRKMFLSSPWPRLGSIGTDVDDDDVWYSKIAALEDSMHYQQDRMNFQFKQEELDIHVSLIPFHIIFRDLYEAIQDGTAPAGITHIRNLFALSNNLDGTSDPTDPTLVKHWYMLNYLGTYAINCLFDAIALDGDPRTKPRTDGYWTVPEPIALWFQNKAIEIRDNYARSGHAIGGEVGYVMPKIRDWTIPEIVGPSLMLHRNTPAVTGTAYPLVRNGTPRHIMAVIDIDTSQDQDGYIFDVRGSGEDKTFAYIWARGGRIDYVRAGYEQGAVEDVLNNRIAQIPGMNRYIMDLILPYPGWINPIDGHNTFLSFLNMDVEHVPYQTEKVGVARHTTPGALSPISTRLICNVPGSQVLDIIISDAVIPDDRKFNIYRNWAVKYQQDTWEPLWPDMVT